MGGHLTVSSIEHKGSTFTFVLPYKVSPISDSSDDPDELSDTDHRDMHGDGNDDDLHCGVFVFQPRTLGSLFSSQSSGRIQKLSPNSYGFGANGLLEELPSPSSNITYNETRSEEDAHSEAGAMQISTEPEISRSNGLGLDNLSSAAKHEESNPDTNGHFHQHAHQNSPLRAKTSLDETSESSIAQATVQKRARNEGTSECSSSNSPEIQKAETKPKILLVDDNKINVMVARSMMKQLGHTIDVVHNGAEAVRAVQSNNYHLVLMVCVENRISHVIYDVPISFFYAS